MGLMYLWCQVPSSSLVLSEGISGPVFLLGVAYLWSHDIHSRGIQGVEYLGVVYSGCRVSRARVSGGLRYYSPDTLLPPPPKPQKHPTGILFCFCFVLVPLSLNYCILFITGLFLLLRCSCSIKHKQKSWPKEAGLSWFTLLFHYCCSPF